jgi:hypothetical protein
MSLDFIGREMHALKGASISAILILFAGLAGGFMTGRMIYQDQAAFWESAYQSARSEARKVVPGLTNKALKQYVLTFEKGATAFSDEYLVSALFRTFARRASETLANVPDENAIVCEAYRSDALRLLDEVLSRLPTVYKSNVANLAYTSGPCSGQLRNVLQDLATLATKLED